ncbi:hypothetical protein AGMMS49579_05340 [Spirochaetia bacterium]|nr:hypothetical protein AGMMS49579_05340 [Spirochaetia bacterium]
MGCTTTPLLVRGNNYSEYSGQYYKISFFAYGPGTPVEGKKSIAGHASVSIDRDGVYGFYPSKPQRFATKKGVLKYSREYPITQDYTDFLVDEDTKNKIVELINEWENNPPPFIVSISDCVKFIYRVCDIMGLNYHPLTLLPKNAVRDIRNLNNHYRIYTALGP